MNSFVPGRPAHLPVCSLVGPYATRARPLGLTSRAASTLRGALRVENDGCAMTMPENVFGVGLSVAAEQGCRCLCLSLLGPSDLPDCRAHRTGKSPLLRSAVAGARCIWRVMSWGRRHREAFPCILDKERRRDERDQRRIALAAQAAPEAVCCCQEFISGSFGSSTGVRQRSVNGAQHGLARIPGPPMMVSPSGGRSVRRTRQRAGCGCGRPVALDGER